MTTNRKPKDNSFGLLTGKNGNATADTFFAVGDRWGAETNGNLGVGDKEYGATIRFSPPYPFMYNMVQLLGVEFFATLFFSVAIYSAQALGVSQAAVSLVKAASLFFVTYTFWHWGKAHVNPAVTLLSCLLGISTWWELVVRTVGGALGMLAATGISWGFFRADGGVGLVGYDYSYGVQWGWEIFYSMMVYAALFWPIVTCRLRWEMSTRWMNKADMESPSVKVFMEKQIVPHAGESKRSHANADHTISLNYALWYGALSYVGSYVTGGIYNGWLWFPRAFDTTVSGSQLGLEFALYFFAPMVGAILLTLVLWGFIFATRTKIVHMFDSEHLEKWNAEMTSGNYSPSTM